MPKSKPPKRYRPRLSVTIDPDVYSSLERARDALPGATMSGVVSELLAISVPMLEQLANSMREAVREDGTIDEARARDRLAHWAGAQLLDLSDTIHAFGREEAKQETAKK